MPIVQVTFIAGPSPEQKRELIANITSVVVQDLGVPPQAVNVVLTETASADWGHAGTPLSETLGR